VLFGFGLSGYSFLSLVQKLAVNKQADKHEYSKHPVYSFQITPNVDLVKIHLDQIWSSANQIQIADL
jgi:hypothetical protein